MPFAYYGAKHGLAKKYPRPRYDTIIEPFAGSAAYSVHHATPGHRVILIEKDLAVVELWRRVQGMTDRDLDAVLKSSNSERTTDPIVGALSGSTGLAGTLSGASRAITPRMRAGLPATVERIRQSLPRVRHWEIVHGSYQEAPDIEATWHIDPPYQPQRSDIAYGTSDQAAGEAYRNGSDGIDYAHLAAWCQSRRGQVMVCEQSPAAWLPFTTFANQTNGANNGGVTRTEVVWLSDQQQLSLL